MLDSVAYTDHGAWYNAPRPERPFRDEVGADPGTLRIGLVAGAPTGIDLAPACADALAAAGRTLEALGHSVVTVPYEVDLKAMVNMSMMINGSYHQPDIDWEHAEPHNRLARQRGTETCATDYVTAVGELQRWSRTFVAAWGRDFDVLVTPTMATEPPTAGSILDAVHAHPEHVPAEMLSMVVFTMVASLAGLPAISLPLHQAESGLPVGVQLVERPWNEAGLLRLASQLEAATPWHDRRPVLSMP